jgi:hypothetical protein
MKHGEAGQITAVINTRQSISKAMFHSRMNVVKNKFE